MQLNKIKDWIKANKLLSAIIVGVIIVVIILYLGQVPIPEDQRADKVVNETSTEKADESQEVVSPETVPENAPTEITVAETTEKFPSEQTTESLN